MTFSLLKEDPAPEGPPLAVEAREIWFGYKSSQAILRGVSLGVKRGEICMILGPSGSGKTTFLKVTRGLLMPQRGFLKVLNVELSGPNGGKVGRLGGSLAYIPQNLGLVRNLTVLDNVLSGALGRVAAMPSLLGVFPKDAREEARRLLQTLGIAHKAGEKVYDISGGERQRVAIARALMQRPQLILGDEFVAHLDSLLTLEIMDIVKGIAAKGVTFIITSHDLELVSRYGDKAVFLREGRVVRECSAHEVQLDWVKAVMQ